ncbi:MAG TPA: branched-chain amino acid aminotransferase [Edaphocola sp.]|nr:branched-chain amino acid aminotransferase [Edaphocola sp.]
MDIKITKSQNSHLHELKKSEIKFGKEHTDHMLTCDYTNGKWQSPEIVPFGDISISPALSALHYGQSIFEGIKAYRQPNGGSAIFRPDKNFERFNKSAYRMDMPEISKEIFIDGLTALIKLDDSWIPNDDETSLYIRPFMFATDGFLGVKTSDDYRFMIINSPAGPYYNHAMSIFVQSTFVRAVKGGIGFTKAAGNYGASMFPTSDVKRKGYDQILWTDAFEHKYVQEIGTMNVFFIIDGKAITPDLNSGTILAGVTRDSVITLLKDNGITVEERAISIDEIVEAFKAGKLEEAFGTGTAASMSLIQDLTYNDFKMMLKPAEEFPISNMIKKQLDDIRYGRAEDKFNWLHKVK